MSATIKTIPNFYKVFFLYIEPFFTLLGAIYAFGLPENYLTLTDAASAPPFLVPIGTNVVLRQLGNLYLCFAINEALVLRATGDLHVWRTFLLGLLIADFGHLYSLFPLGFDVYWNISRWSAMDWGNVAFVYFGASMRMAFLAGVAFSSGGPGRKPKSMTRTSPRKKRT